MNNVVYVKQAKECKDIANNKIVYYLKNFLNIITKKEINGYNIYILPYIKKISKFKLNLIYRKLSKETKIYVLPDYLENKNLIEKYNINFVHNEETKKYLLIEILENIGDILKKDINTLDLTVLINKPKDEDYILLEKLALRVRSLKIVSLQIHKFKQFENKLYNEYGIAVQFSNSYRKSIAKERIIINIDFRNVDINEYNIFKNAIIINCHKDNIKINGKAFEGIVINSLNIKFNKTILEEINNLNIINEYSNLKIFQSLILNKFNNINDNIKIKDLIGYNGKISKNEFKKIAKTIDKSIKTE